MKTVFRIDAAIAVLLAAAEISFAAPKEKKNAPVQETAGIVYLDSNFKTWDSIQKDIHRYAEPGFQEYKSSRRLADELERNGFKIETGVAGMPTAFVATYGSGAPVIGILGEFDALVGMSQDTVTVEKPVREGNAGHACGHNLLGSASAAGAIAISKWLAQGHKGTIKFYGCPAEEGGGGKGYLVREGYFKGVDLVLDWHPDTKSAASLKAGLANVRVRFTFKGKASHASGSPWIGRSALDGVEAFDYMMNLMREHVTPETRIHYAITNGGQAPNVVPVKAEVEYYIRHARAEEVMNVFERAQKAAQGAAMGTGTQVSWEVMNGVYEKLPNTVIAKVLQRNLQKVGGIKLTDREKEFCTELQKSAGYKKPGNLSGMETVSPDIIPASSGGGSSDVGCVSQVVPLATLRYACMIPGTASHSWQWAANGGTSIGTKALINVAKVFYLSAVEIYGNPALVKEIKDEYIGKQGKDFKYVSLVGDRKPALDYCRKNVE